MKRRIGWAFTLMLIFTLVLNIIVFIPFASAASAKQLYAQQIGTINPQQPKELTNYRKKLIEPFFKTLEKEGFDLRKVESITITPDGSFSLETTTFCDQMTPCPEKPHCTVIGCDQHTCQYDCPN